MLDELIAQYLKLPVFALVASRLAGLLMFQPVLGALAIPINLRALLVLALAALLTPMVDLPAGAPDSPLGLTLAMGGEILLGALIGIVAIAAFWGVQLGILLIAQESGLAFGQIVDPTSDEQETVLGVFYVQIAIAIFLIVGGHRAIMGACLDTFESLPLLAARGVTAADLELITRSLTLGCDVALKVAAPALLTLFLVNLAMGFVSRTMPQLNLLAVGFSIKSLVAFLLLAVALPSAADAFLVGLESTTQWLQELLTA